VARALQRVIDAEHARLSVVGSTTRGAIGQIAPGTTAQRVINGGGCPVVIVPHGYDAPSCLSTIGVVFVATPAGRTALREAAAIAWIADAQLRVLAALKPRLGAGASAGPTRQAAEGELAALEGTVASAIAELVGGVQTHIARCLSVTRPTLW
jgi:hypothetical protein